MDYQTTPLLQMQCFMKMNLLEFTRASSVLTTSKSSLLYGYTVFIRIKAGIKYTQGLKYTPRRAAE